MTLNARKRLAARAAKAAAVDALLVTHLPDVRWLCGFTGSNAALVFSGSRAVLFTDGRYTTQAKSEAAGTRVVIAPKSAMIAACEWMATAKVMRCGFDEGNTTVASLDQMRGRLSDRKTPLDQGWGRDREDARSRSAWMQAL